jgi:hypothetical protein
MAKMEREGRSPRLTLSCVKSKDAAEWESIDLRLEPIGDSCVLSRVVEVEDVAEQVAQIEADVLAFVTANAPVSKRAIRGGITGRNPRIDAALEALARRGLVKSSRKGWEACPEAPGTLGHADSEDAGGGVPHDGTPSRREGPSGHAPLRDVPEGPGHGTQHGAEPDPLTAAVDADPDTGDKLDVSYLNDLPEAEAEAEWNRLQAQQAAGR